MNFWRGFLISDKVSDFVFCVMVMLIKENKKSAYLLAFSSIIGVASSSMGELLLTSFIGKAIALGYSILMPYFFGRIEKRMIRKN